MKLAIISHTEHYRRPDGTLVGWGPTVNELNHLLELFDEIYHVAMLHEGVAPASALPYSSSSIHFVGLPAVGGRSIHAKLGIVWQAPKVIATVSSTLKEVDYFQLRSPTGIGVYLIPYLTWFTKKKGWYKYAGNWNQKRPPLGYRLQRWMLKKQSHKVTINGRWPSQPKHCLSFENPCLTAQDLVEGQLVGAKKGYDGPLDICFVGRLEAEKGVGRIIEAISSLQPEEKQRIGQVHFVGEGKELTYYKTLAAASGVSMVFYGGLARQKVFEIYKVCQVFMLPTTASEGFPKVIAEAMNFGCIPIVSDVSAIAQYVQDEKQGFVLADVGNNDIVICLRKVFSLDQDGFRVLVKAQEPIVKTFTFGHYNTRIKQLLDLH